LKRQNARKPDIVVSAFFLGFLIVILYSRTIFGAFIYDDNYYIRDNPAIRSLTNIPAFFTRPETAIAHTGQSRLIYRPLTTTFFAFEYYAFGGAHPASFHFVSIILFLLLVGLLMGLTQMLYDDSAPVIAAGAFVAVHPLCTETVGWISAQPTLLCALCMLASLGAFLFASKGALKWRNPAFAACLVFAVAAMLFKEVGIMTPLVLLAAHFSFVDEEQSGRRLRIIGLTAAASIFYLVIRLFLLGGLGGSSLYSNGILGHVAAAVSVVPRYLKRFFFPMDLRVFYSLPSSGILEILIGLSFLIGAPTAAWRLRKKRPVAAFGLALAFLTYLPASNLIPTGMPTAERYFFLPLIGLAIAAADLLSPVMRGPKAGFAVPVMVFIGCCFAILTFERGRIWGSEVNFWERAIAEQPGLDMGYYNLALVHADKEEMDEAEKNYRKVLSMNPDHARAANNLGIVLARQERYDEATPYLQKAVEANPYNWRAAENLVRVQLKQDRPEAVVSLMQRLLNEARTPALEKMATALLESDALGEELRRRLAAEL